MHAIFPAHPPAFRLVVYSELGSEKIGANERTNEHGKLISARPDSGAQGGTRMAWVDVMSTRTRLAQFWASVLVAVNYLIEFTMVIDR